MTTVFKFLTRGVGDSPRGLHSARTDELKEFLVLDHPPLVVSNVCKCHLHLTDGRNYSTDMTDRSITRRKILSTPLGICYGQSVCMTKPIDRDGS